MFKREKSEKPRQGQAAKVNTTGEFNTGKLTSLRSSSSTSKLTIQASDPDLLKGKYLTFPSNSSRSGNAPQTVQIGNMKLTISLKDNDTEADSEIQGDNKKDSAFQSGMQIARQVSGDFMQDKKLPKPEGDTTASETVYRKVEKWNAKSSSSTKDDGDTKQGKNTFDLNSGQNTSGADGEDTENRYITVVHTSVNAPKKPNISPKKEEVMQYRKFRRRTARKVDTTHVVTNSPTHSTSTPQLVPTRGPLTLKEVANSPNIHLPQLVQVKRGYTCPIGGSATQGDVLLLVDIRKVTAANGVCIENGQPVRLLQNSKYALSLVSDELSMKDWISVDNLLSAKRLPPTVRVMETFTPSKGRTVSKGTYLFFEKDAKQQARLSRKAYLKARDSNSENFTLNPSDKKIFSINPQDVNIQLHEIIGFLQPQMMLQVNVHPVSKLVSVECVCQEDVLVAQPFDMKESRPKLQYFEMPVSWDVIVQTVSTKEDTLGPHNDAIYSKIDELSTEEEVYDEYSYVVNGKSFQRFNSCSENFSTSMLRTMSPPSSQSSAELKLQSRAENVAFLKKLGVDGVQMILDSLKMTQFKELFLEEGIDGEILSSLTEEDLLEELDVKRRLDRVRLMKIIEGHHSVRKIMNELYI
jgi:hypothetical protein